MKREPWVNRLHGGVEHCAHGISYREICAECWKDDIPAPPSNEQIPVYRVDALLTSDGQELLYPKRNFVVVALEDHQEAIKRLTNEAAMRDGELTLALEQYREANEERKRLRAALNRFTAVKSQAPIARIFVADHSLVGKPPKIVGGTLYAPSLPPGEYDLYCEPEATAPMLRESPSETANER